MTRRVEVLRPDVPVHDAVRVMLRRGYSAVPVTEPDGTLLGVFSEHDCIRVLADAAYEGWPAGTVARHMTKDVETVGPEEELLSLARRFGESRHRALPVTSGNRVVGLVQRADLVRALDRLLEVGGVKTTYEILSERRR